MFIPLQTLIYDGSFSEKSHFLLSTCTYLLLVTSAHYENTHTRARSHLHKHTPKPCQGIDAPLFDFSLLNWLMLHDSMQAETAPPPPTEGIRCTFVQTVDLFYSVCQEKNKKSRADAELLNWGFAARFQHHHTARNKNQCTETSVLLSETWTLPLHNNVLVFSVKWGVFLVHQTENVCLILFSK